MTRAGVSPGDLGRLEDLSRFKDQFVQAMEDDLNTADALAAVFEMITAINTAVKEGAGGGYAKGALSRLMELCDILGLLQHSADESVDDEVQKLIDERQEARKNKDFARSDQIRDILKARGITLKDTPQGVQIIKE